MSSAIEVSSALEMQGLEAPRRILRLVPPLGDAERSWATPGASCSLVPAARPQLSAREAEVLRVWLFSDSKREIAEQLGLSVGTVNTYLVRVREKYAAVDRPACTKSALMARALQDGLVGLHEF